MASIASVSVAQPDTWTQVPDLGYVEANGPASRSYAVSFVVEGRAFVGLGLGTCGDVNGYMGDLWEFMPETGVWSSRAAFPTGPGPGLTAFTLGGAAYVLYNTVFVRYDPATDGWTSLEAPPVGIAMGVASFVIDDIGYVVGINGRELWSYDPVSAQWQQRADYGGGQFGDFMAFSINGAGYVVGGLSGFYYGDFWSYDPVQDMWTQRAEFPAQVTNGVAMTDGTVGLICGGFEGSGYSSSLCSRYSPVTDEWSAVATLPGAGAGAGVGFHLNGAWYHVCGSEESSGVLPMNDVLSYDPGTDEWTAEVPFGGWQVDPAATFVLEGEGYVVGSQTWKMAVLKYSSLTGQWSHVGEPPMDPRSNAVAFSVGGYGYYGTGRDPWNAREDMWRYDPLGGSWQQVANMPNGPRSSAIAFVIDGIAYAGLGYLRNDLWVYDHEADQWEQRSSLPVSDFSDPDVFVLGGQAYVTVWHNGIQDFWRYDPGSDSWSWVDQPPFSPRIGTAGFSLNGLGYFVGGYSNSATQHDDLWMFDPASGEWAQAAAFPGLRHGAVSFVIGDTAYVGTGVDTTPIDGLAQWCASSTMWAYHSDLSVSMPMISGTDLSISPNPATDVLSLFHKEPLAGYEVWTSLGSLVVRVNEQLAPGRSGITVGQLRPGSYFLRTFEPMGGSRTLSFLIMR